MVGIPNSGKGADILTSGIQNLTNLEPLDFGGRLMRRHDLRKVTVVLAGAMVCSACGGGAGGTAPGEPEKAFVAKGKLKSNEEANARLKAQGKSAPPP
jgi:hypothetical protein